MLRSTCDGTVGTRQNKLPHRLPREPLPGHLPIVPLCRLAAFETRHGSKTFASSHVGSILKSRIITEMNEQIDQVFAINSIPICDRLPSMQIAK